MASIVRTLKSVMRADQLQQTQPRDLAFTALTGSNYEM
jgi:hypothetical protein